MKITRTGLAVLLIAGLTQSAEEFEIKDYSPSAGTGKSIPGAGVDKTGSPN